jgi:hypothetical protein
VTGGIPDHSDRSNLGQRRQGGGPPNIGASSTTSERVAVGMVGGASDTCQSGQHRTVARFESAFLRLTARDGAISTTRCRGLAERSENESEFGYSGICAERQKG